MLAVFLLLATFATLATPTRDAILQAEDRRAPTAEDLATIREGLQSPDDETLRIAVRALGRLERPALIADLQPMLAHRLPAIRAEAATAIGQAAQGWKRNPPEGWMASLDAAQAVLIDRLKIEPDANVRLALADTIGRLPYAQASEADNAERAILTLATRPNSPTDRLALATGLFRLTRLQRNLRPLSAEARAALAELVNYRGTMASEAARVRGVALEGYLALGPPDPAVIKAASSDADEQVRRLAVRGAVALAQHDGGGLITTAAADSSPMVRIEAMRGLVNGHAENACALLLKGSSDSFTPVALSAIDELAKCGSSPEAVEALVRAVSDLSRASAPRAWHRAAHSLVALATAAPEKAAATLDAFSKSRTWQLRLYAARAAATLHNRAALEALANDEDDNVREEAIDSLARLAGHDADAIFIAQFSRTGNQVLRSAALALAGTPQPDRAIPVLQSTLQRLIAEGRDNSHDAREAIGKALDSLHPGSGQPKVSVALANGSAAKAEPGLDTNTLRRLASSRARITMRDVGTFELTLLPDEAPASVLRFVHLAERGYFNDLTFHRIVPNFVIQGGSPGANEYIGDTTFMRDEVGRLPQVRGTLGVSTRGRDTGDAQIYVNLVDNPRLDHEFTVFAEVVRGIDVVDRILEGDVIERVEIIPAR